MESLKIGFHSSGFKISYHSWVDRYRDRYDNIKYNYVI